MSPIEQCFQRCDVSVSIIHFDVSVVGRADGVVLCRTSSLSVPFKEGHLHFYVSGFKSTDYTLTLLIFVRHIRFFNAKKALLEGIKH